MPNPTFASFSDFDFSANIFLDNSGKTGASAFSWVKPADELGLHDIQIHDLSGNATNLAAYNAYGDALIRNKTSAAIRDGTPLGVRYFMPAGGDDTTIKCMTPDGSVVKQYYVVDGLSNAAIVSTPAGSPAHQGDGIVFSAKAAVNKIDSANISPYFEKVSGTDDILLKPAGELSYNRCKKVQITTNAGGNTDSNFVSESDAESLIASKVATEAFHNRITHGHDGEWSRPVSGTDLGGYIMGGDIRPTVSHAIPVHDPDDFDYMRARRWLEDQMSAREAANTASKKSYDAVTGFFIGSVTVLGLFVVFRFLDIRSVARR